MAIFTCNGKKEYIDDRLSRELDEVCYQVKYHDSDAVLCVDGNEGDGKSKKAENIGAYCSVKLGTTFTEDNFHLSPQAFRDAILRANKNEIVIYDEAHKGMGSRRSLSEINGILNDLMMEMRQKNLIVILVLPTFFMLDKYPAIFRTKGLLHVYRGVNKKTGKKERGYWVYFNQKYKLQLYIKGKQYFNYNCIEWPSFRGRFYDQWVIDKKKYREKKKEGFKQHGKRETKAETYKLQRNKAIAALKRELNIGIPNLKKILDRNGIKFSEKGIRDAILDAELNFKEDSENKDGETKDNEGN